MISKNEVKYIQSLSHKKNRDTDGVFIAETPKLVNELLQSGTLLKKIYATSDWIGDYRGDLPIQEVDMPALQRISQLETPNKVLAIAEQKKTPSLNLNNRITLVLDGIQDPGNLGTILRIADWFGVYQVVATKDTADCYNSKTVQSSMGSILRVNIWYEDIVSLLAVAAIPVFGALLEGQSIYDTGVMKEGVLVIGNEAKGIRSNILPYIQYPLTIPRIGGAESLNAAVAAGIMLSHLIRPKI